MNVMSVMCSDCAGMGKQINWKAVDLNDNKGTVKKEEVVCEACNGKGCVEYAIFTIEEAKTILKHCDLITEN